MIDDPSLRQWLQDQIHRMQLHPFAYEQLCARRFRELAEEDPCVLGPYASRHPIRVCDVQVTGHYPDAQVVVTVEHTDSGVKAAIECPIWATGRNDFVESPHTRVSSMIDGTIAPALLSIMREAGAPI